MTFIVTVSYNPCVSDPHATQPPAPTAPALEATTTETPATQPSPTERRLARRAERLAAQHRPNRRGEAWDIWAEELTALLNARAYQHVRPPLTRAQFLYLCSADESAAQRYTLALQALDLAAHLGFNRTVLRRVPFTRLAAAMRYADKPNTFAVHLNRVLGVPRPKPDAAEDHPLEARRRVHGKR